MEPPRTRSEDDPIHVVKEEGQGGASEWINDHASTEFSEIVLSALMKSTGRLPGLEAESGYSKLGGKSGSFAVSTACHQHYLTTTEPTSLFPPHLLPSLCRYLSTALSTGLHFLCTRKLSLLSTRPPFVTRPRRFGRPRSIASCLPPLHSARKRCVTLSFNLILIKVFLTLGPSKLITSVSLKSHVVDFTVNDASLTASKHSNSSVKQVLYELT